MSHWFRRYCYVCGDPVEAGGDGTHCRRHTAATNRPWRLARKYCGWCGRQQAVDDPDECGNCQSEETRVAGKTSELAEDLNSRPASKLPEWYWCNCPHCGLYTICFRAKPGLLQSLAGSYATRQLECGNCRQRFEKDV